jgi:hypothetical protein
MGVETSWNTIKSLCLVFVVRSFFLGHLVHFIRRAFGEEHQKLICDSGFLNAFIRQPVVIKAMWDAMQDRHQHTLSCCIVVTGLKKNANYTNFSAVITEVMQCWDSKIPLHLKLVMYY